MKMVSGNQTRGWSLNALPQKMSKALSVAAGRRKLGAEDLLESPELLWRPQYPLSRLANGAIERASLLCRALAPCLAQMDDVSLPRPDIEKFGVQHYRQIFGHGVSTEHWRRLLKRTLERDRGAKNWSRLEIYLDEYPLLSSGLSRPKRFAGRALEPLRELIASSGIQVVQLMRRKIASGFMLSSIRRMRLPPVRSQKQLNKKSSDSYMNTHHFSGDREPVSGFSLAES